MKIILLYCLLSSFYTSVFGLFENEKLSLYFENKEHIGKIRKPGLAGWKTIEKLENMINAYEENKIDYKTLYSQDILGVFYTDIVEDADWLRKLRLALPDLKSIKKNSHNTTALDTKVQDIERNVIYDSSIEQGIQKNNNVGNNFMYFGGLLEKAEKAILNMQRNVITFLNELISDDKEMLGSINGYNNPTVIIVLGCKEDAILYERADLAVQLARKFNDIPIVVSGKGFDPVSTEAQKIENHLIKNLVAKDRIIREEFSMDTIGNAIFSRLILHWVYKARDRPLIVTSDFHSFRSLYLFQQAFDDAVENVAVAMVHHNHDEVKTMKIRTNLLRIQNLNSQKNTLYHEYFKKMLAFSNVGKLESTEQILAGEISGQALSYSTIYSMKTNFKYNIKDGSREGASLKYDICSSFYQLLIYNPNYDPEVLNLDGVKQYTEIQNMCNHL